MSNLRTFFGPPAVISLVGNASTSGSDVLTYAPTAATLAANNVQQILAGTTVADTYKTLLNVTGAGFVNFLAGRTLNATSRNMAIRLTLDGIVVGERNIVGATAIGRTLVCVGSVQGSFASTTVAPLTFSKTRFNKSLLVEMQSSLAETNFIAALINYELTA